LWSAAVARPTLLDRTFGNLGHALREIAAGAGLGFAERPDPDLAGEGAERLRAQMRACLEAKGGEALARVRAAGLIQAYLSLSATGRLHFFRMLAGDFGLERERIEAATTAYLGAVDEEARQAAEARLKRALVAPRVRLLTQLNALPGAVKLLVDMRAELIRARERDPLLAALDDDFRHLLATWFDVGFLRLERITWDSPASLLEKLIAYEAVHEIRSWSDLRHRLAEDRRCWAFFHPAMPGEPLIFVQVALVRGIASSVQALLDESGPEADPEAADGAVFYSITNTQDGLRGISFGNFLIKQVVDELARELPRLRHFATLSPLPGFRAWLEPRPQLFAELLDEDARKALDAAGRGPAEAPLSVLARPDWHLEPQLAGALARPLCRAAARYLLARDERGRPIDPVARFHLGNGARIERLSAGGDVSRRGLEQAAGVMVSYRYEREEIERNHEAFAGDGTVTVAPEIAELLKGAPPEEILRVRVGRRRGALGRMIGRG
jgi:malonyl-CoA decarboxylase